jgi:Holliday junction resolvase RusA-like endonuclease
MMSEYPTLVVEMSLPPGVNKAYNPVRSSRGAKLIKSKEARQWSAYAQSQITQQAGVAVCRNKFRALIQMPVNATDTDAAVKEILDTCKYAGVIKDDASRYNMGFTVEVVRGLRPGWMRVSLWALPDDYLPPDIYEGMEEDMEEVA